MNRKTHIEKMVIELAKAYNQLGLAHIEDGELDEAQSAFLDARDNLETNGLVTTFRENNVYVAGPRGHSIEAVSQEALDAHLSADAGLSFVERKIKAQKLG